MPETSIKQHLLSNLPSKLTCILIASRKPKDVRLGGSLDFAANNEAAMKTFVFETTIDALVRVRAADEDSARKVIPTVLGAPGTADIRIANESIGVGLGIQAVIDDVKFNAAPDMVLLEVNSERVKRRRR
jgi:hypothetical protein